MSDITPTSKAQRAVFRIDHRCLECEFYRVQAVRPGEHRAVIKVIRDAGANLDTMTLDEWQIGKALRREFNRKGWAYIIDDCLRKLVKLSQP